MRESPLSDPVEQAKLYRQVALRLLGHWLFLILLVGAIGATWLFLVIAIIWACTLA